MPHTLLPPLPRYFVYFFTLPLFRNRVQRGQSSVQGHYDIKEGLRVKRSQLVAVDWPYIDRPSSSWTPTRAYAEDIYIN